MAATKELSLLVTLNDKASRQLQGLQGKLENMQPTFRTMAAVGTAAFVGVGAGMYKAIDAARGAEDIDSLFSLAFGNIQDEAAKTTKAFSDEFGRSESRIKDSLARVAFQFDASTEMSKEKMLELSESMLPASEGLALLDNNVESGTDVMQAFSDALAGQNQNLGRMIGGYEEADIEAQALKEGIIEEGQELDKTSRALALHSLFMDRTTASQEKMSQENRGTTDSMIRLRDSFSDLVEKAGKPFLEQTQQIADRITPIIDKISEWIEQNPKLTRHIILAAGAIAGLVAVVGLLGMALPFIITGFSFLLGPLGLAIALLIPLAKILWDNREAVIAFVKDALERLKEIWEELKPKLVEFWENLKRLWSIVKSSLKPVFDSLIDSLKEMWTAVSELWNLLSPVLIPTFRFLAKVIGTVVFLAIMGFIGLTATVIKWTAKLVTAIADWYTKSIKKWVEFYEKVKELWGKLGKKWEEFKEDVVQLMKDLWEDIKKVWEDIKDAFKDAVDWIMDKTIGRLIKGFEKVVELAEKTKKTIKGIGGKVAGGARNIAISAADAAARVRDAIPLFADGGIVTRPTLGLVGEAGPEAIIPLDQMGKGGTTVNVTVNGDVSGRELIDTVKNAIFKEVNRQVKI